MPESERESRTRRMFEKLFGPPKETRTQLLVEGVYDTSDKRFVIRLRLGKECVTMHPERARKISDGLAFAANSASANNTMLDFLAKDLGLRGPELVSKMNCYLKRAYGDRCSGITPIELADLDEESPE